MGLSIQKLIFKYGIISQLSFPTPRALYLKNIEKEMGEKRKLKTYEDRIIDLDILIYNNVTINSTKLSLPHPKIRMKNFLC